jgi:hypothetical protein
MVQHLTPMRSIGFIPTSLRADVFDSARNEPVSFRGVRPTRCFCASLGRTTRNLLLQFIATPASLNSEEESLA